MLKFRYCEKATKVKRNLTQMWSACHKKSYLTNLEVRNLKSAVSVLCGCLSFACFEKKWGKFSWIFQNSSIWHITNTFSYDMPTTLAKKLAFSLYRTSQIYTDFLQNIGDISVGIFSGLLYFLGQQNSSLHHFQFFWAQFWLIFHWRHPLGNNPLFHNPTE